jgi:hypothetical protein
MQHSRRDRRYSLSLPFRRVPQAQLRHNSGQDSISEAIKIVLDWQCVLYNALELLK